MPARYAARLEVLVDDLVVPAKAPAFEKLGQGERGLGIATDWLRTKLCGGFAGA